MDRRKEGLQDRSGKAGTVPNCHGVGRDSDGCEIVSDDLRELFETSK